jgi:hypothetical protein
MDMKTFPKIESVAALPSKKLRVTFQGGYVRIYDCRPLLKEEPFKPLQDEVLFRSARADKHGYAVIWGDDIDLAESEIWINGRSERIRTKTRGSALGHGR